MDGHFVPNISFGALVVKALRPHTKLALECHLMITDPDKYIDDFVKAGADTILVHVENNANLHRTVQLVRHHGKRAGVVINPATPALSLVEILPDVDMVLVMTVNPGFGGQQFLKSTLAKIRAVRQMIDRVKPDVELEVDGGIEAHTTPLVVEAGARVLVAGSAVFGYPGGIAAGVEALKKAAGG